MTFRPRNYTSELGHERGLDKLTATAAPAADAQPAAARSPKPAPDSRTGDDPCPCRLAGRTRGSD